MPETLNDRLEAHDNLSGNDAEISNLRDLVSHAFDLLTPEQCAKILADCPLDPNFTF